MTTKPRCKCGAPAKWRGDRVGDHEMGSLYYPMCGGRDCVADLHKRFPIETDATGEFRIVDKGGPNIVILAAYESMATARDAWPSVVRNRMSAST